MARRSRPAPAPDPTTRILDRAEELFAERGLSGTSIRELAARCGLQSGSLYGPFRGKREIYEAVLRRGLEPVIALIRRAVDADLEDGWGDILIGELVDHLRANPALPKLIAHEALRIERGEKSYLDEWARQYAIEGLALMRRRGRLSGDWSEREGPLLLCAWFNLIFGYFANASLFERMLGGDPLADPLIGLQTEVLAKLGQRVPAERDACDAGAGTAGRRESDPLAGGGSGLRADGWRASFGREADRGSADDSGLSRENAVLRELLADQALEIVALRERLAERKERRG